MIEIQSNVASSIIANKFHTNIKGKLLFKKEHQKFVINQVLKMSENWHI